MSNDAKFTFLGRRITLADRLTLYGYILRGLFTRRPRRPRPPALGVRITYTMTAAEEARDEICDRAHFARLVLAAAKIKRLANNAAVSVTLTNEYGGTAVY